MITYAEVMERTALVEEYVSIWEVEADEEDVALIRLTVEDFDGFDEHWHEVARYYDVDAVGALVGWLKGHCLAVEDEYCMVYHFDGFDVSVGYASYDI